MAKLDTKPSGYRVISLEQESPAQSKETDAEIIERLRERPCRSGCRRVGCAELLGQAASCLLPRHERHACGSCPRGQLHDQLADDTPAYNGHGLPALEGGQVLRRFPVEPQHVAQHPATGSASACYRFWTFNFGSWGRARRFRVVARERFATSE